MEENATFTIREAIRATIRTANGTKKRHQRDNQVLLLERMDSIYAMCGGLPIETDCYAFSQLTSKVLGSKQNILQASSHCEADFEKGEDFVRGFLTLMQHNIAPGDLKWQYVPENVEKKEPKPRVCRAKGLMYIDVKINRKSINAMIDTGATYNYFASPKVERIGVVLKKGSGKVNSINSVAQPIAGVAKSLLIKVDPFEGITDLLIVQIDDFKLILVLEFLCDTKTVVLSYSDSLMIMESKPGVIPKLVTKMDKKSISSM
ncbi:Uncharacterized protein Adt_12787 [Abeliophyllum distichum]|uniref:Uncharacterized protein n=1 Tax=Abeliophyllum distichum TaxID=126358 RepID=A0ABD1UTI9_9LAMI